MVLASVYSSKLTSSLTFTDRSLPFTSLAELVTLDSYTWGLVPGTAQEIFVKVRNLWDIASLLIEYPRSRLGVWNFYSFLVTCQLYQ